MKIVAILAALFLGGIGMKLMFATAPTAAADPPSIKVVGVDISRLHQTARNLPVQQFQDMALVFPVSD